MNSTYRDGVQILFGREFAIARDFSYCIWQYVMKLLPVVWFTTLMFHLVIKYKPLNLRIVWLICILWKVVYRDFFNIFKFFLHFIWTFFVWFTTLIFLYIFVCKEVTSWRIWIICIAKGRCVLYAILYIRFVSEDAMKFNR